MGTTSRRLAAAIGTFNALWEAGYEVICPSVTHPPTEDADDLLTVVDEDMSCLAGADILAITDGCEGLWEPVYAQAVGIPVVYAVELLNQPMSA
ncbi:hypothetical protein OG792_32945 [Micromonospora sp. NBC_01699]|uniref:hypothetical protein n=1 Tax=Micromonospora sp. NBC_01699 TaxID=2975984 RepID=UPI002E2D9461|nr:hypothetical protein [Micromonospora sp. NBC_01699]